MKKLVLMGSLLALFAPRIADSESILTGASLEKINNEIEALSLQLSELRKDQDDARLRSDAVRRELSLQRREEERFNSEIDRLSEQRGWLLDQISSLEVKTSAQRDLSLSRVRTFFMSQKPDFWETILLSRIESLERSLFYLSRIRKSDEQLIMEWAATARTQREKQLELEGVIDAQSEVRNLIIDRRRKISRTLAEQESLLLEVNARAAQIQELLNSLRAQALRMETVMKSLTAGDNLTAVSSEVRRAGPASLVAAGPRENVRIEAFDGAGLFVQRGSLALPARALSRIRSLKRSEIEGMRESTVLLSLVGKGLLFNLPARAPIQSIAAGSVIHAGRLPVYGQVVILDHGKRYYSVYGRLSSLSVSRGDLVEKGQALGKAGEGEGTFYFEIRENGNYLSPNSFYSREL